MDQHDAQTLLARIKTALDRTAERLKASKAALARETESPADHEAAMLRLPPTDRGQE